MKIQFEIQYTNKNGDVIETNSCADKSDRQFFHDLLDEYLNNNHNWKNDSDCHLMIWGFCESHNHKEE